MAIATYAREGYTVCLDALLKELRPWFRLYTNDPVDSPERVRGDFVQATFGGYVPIGTPKWSPAWLRGGRAFAVADPVIFRWNGGDVGDPVRGYYVTDGPDGPLLWFARRSGDAWTPTVSEPTFIALVRMTFPPAAAP